MVLTGLVTGMEAAGASLRAQPRCAHSRGRPHRPGELNHVPGLTKAHRAEAGFARPHEAAPCESARPRGLHLRGSLAPRRERELGEKELTEGELGESLPHPTPYHLCFLHLKGLTPVS